MKRIRPYMFVSITASWLNISPFEAIYCNQDIWCIYCKHSRSMKGKGSVFMTSILGRITIPTMAHSNHQFALGSYTTTLLWLSLQSVEFKQYYLKMQSTDWTIIFAHNKWFPGHVFDPNNRSIWPREYSQSNVGERPPSHQNVFESSSLFEVESRRPWTLLSKFDLLLIPGLLSEICLDSE